MTKELQVSATKIMSQTSSIAECDKEGLEGIIWEAYDALNRFISANENIARLEGLLNFYKWRLSCGTILNVVIDPGQAKVDKHLKMYVGDISREELGEEWAKRIGPYTSFQEKIYGDPLWGYGSKKDMQSMIETLTKEIKEINAQKMSEEEFKRKIPVIEFIPPDYRYPLALKTMLGFVRNLRASNWKECANLYEEQLHRWQMEINSAEGLELQLQTRILAGEASKNSAWAALFSGLSLLRK